MLSLFYFYFRLNAKLINTTAFINDNVESVKMRLVCRFMSLFFLLLPQPMSLKQQEEQEELYLFFKISI